MTRILWISPVGNTRSNPGLKAELDRARRADTQIEVRSLPRGPDHLEFHSFSAFVIPDILHMVLQARREGFDAAIIGCGYDPGLIPAREIAGTMAVVGPAQAALHLATSVASTFSIIEPTRSWIQKDLEFVRKYGHEDKLASFVVCDPEMHVTEFLEQPAVHEKAVLEAGRKAIANDGAEALVLLCSGEYGIFERLQDKLGVPVIDTVVSTLKYAEYLAEVRRFGWTMSHAGYLVAPPDDELDRTMQIYGLGDASSHHRSR